MSDIKLKVGSKYVTVDDELLPEDTGKICTQCDFDLQNTTRIDIEKIKDELDNTIIIDKVGDYNE